MTAPPTHQAQSPMAIREGPKIEFVSPHKYMWDWESQEDYTHGGLCPIHLGDLLGENNRFRVVHKLGAGGYSTVWLCWDNQSPESRWNALKIIRAAAYEEGCPELNLMEMYSHLGISPAEALANGVVIPLDSFTIVSANGMHLCLVLPLMGPDLKGLSLEDDDSEAGRALVKNICHQLTKAVGWLHSEGVIHGDLRPANVLTKLKGVDQLSEEEMLQLLGGTPEAIETYVNPWEKGDIPKYIVVPAVLPGSTSEHFCFEIAITDFSIAFHINSLRNQSFTPMDYRAPEWELGGRIGYETDIWALGCIFMELSVGARPFKGLYSVLPMVEQWEAFNGPLPVEYRGKLKEVFGEDGAQDGNGQRKYARYSGPENDEYNKHGVVMDPSKMAYCCPGSLKQIQELSMEKGGVKNSVHASLLKPRHRLVQIQEEGQPENEDQPREGGEAQGEDKRVSIHVPKGYKAVPLKLSELEVDQMMDLLRKIFRWMPEDRPSIEDILSHPWFDGRISAGGCGTTASVQAPTVTNVTPIVADLATGEASQVTDKDPMVTDEVPIITHESPLDTHKALLATGENPVVISQDTMVTDEDHTAEEHQNQGWILRQWVRDMGITGMGQNLTQIFRDWASSRQSTIL